MRRATVERRLFVRRPAHSPSAPTTPRVAPAEQERAGIDQLAGSVLSASFAACLHPPLPLLYGLPMPRYLIERTFTRSIEEMPPVASRSKRIVSTAFPEITWEHSHVVVGDDGLVRTFCVYSAPHEEMVREHSRELGDHIIDVIHEIAGDVSPEDLPDE